MTMVSGHLHLVSWHAPHEFLSSSSFQLQLAIADAEAKGQLYVMADGNDHGVMHL